MSAHSNPQTVTRAIRICLERRVHFAAYRLPDTKDTNMIVQRDPVLQPLNNTRITLPQRGFLIAPFSKADKPSYLIKPDIVVQGQVTPRQWESIENLSQNSAIYTHDEAPEDTQREEYLQLIFRAIKRIHAGEFEKVVLSRVKTLDGNKDKLPEVFSSLCQTYPHAFVYLFCANGQFWTGATPEPFMCSHARDLVTVSLAGTRPYNRRNLNIANWNRKELEEQEYVTLHIRQILAEYAVSEFTKNGPFVSRAGNLLHLRTDFTFSAAALGNRLPSLIDSLHPTPAVCGMSTGRAMDFISAAEKHKREYYTGYLGPVGFGSLLQLYVNLRCLQAFDRTMVLYVGGGITSDSQAVEEWDETEIKSETLLSVLKQIQ